MLLILLLLVASDPEPIAVAVPARTTPVSYASEVADLLDGKCTACHGDVVSKGKLRLTSVASMLKGGKHGPAIIAGKADSSLLFTMAAHRVEPVMPPKDKAEHKPLTPAELGLLKLWIDAGASDDSAAVAAALKPIQLGELPAGVHPVVAVDITSDGKRVAVGRANVVQVYEVDSGLLIATLGGHKDIVQSLRFRPDGRALAAGSYQTVTRWNLPLMSEAKTLAGHAGAVRAAVASPDGSIIYSAGEDRTIRAWDVAKGKSLRQIATAPIAIGSLALSPDGKTLAAGTFDGTIRVYPVEAAGDRLTLRGHIGPVNGLAFVDDGKRLASAGSDGLARLWTLPSNTAEPMREAIVIRGHTGAPERPGRLTRWPPFRHGRRG